MRLLADAMQLTGEDRDCLFSAVSPRQAVDHALPSFPDTLIGRADEVRTVSELLIDGPARLLTLTGPGGVGKSRVAVAAAAETGARFTGGVRWVDAGQCAGLDELVSELGEALGADPGACTSKDALAYALRHAEALVVIDRAEPTLDHVRALCATLLSRTTRLRLLITSRERLHLPAEVVVPIGPLALPALPRDAAEALEQSPASRLFLARASFPRPDATDPEQHAAGPLDAAAIHRICHRVDGVPLAIELAAARTTVLSIRELATALDKTLRILSIPNSDDEVGLRDVMVGDTYHLLSVPEQTLLARLSVFSDVFTHESVRGICAGADLAENIIDTLFLLVSKSLVQRVDDAGETATFKLLRIVREFAQERLDEDLGREETRRRYAHYFRDLAARAAPHLSGQGQEHWASVVDAESDNLRRAFAWCQLHDNDSALALVGALGPWWQLRGYYQEGRSWANAALRFRSEAPAALRAPALIVAGRLSLLQCDFEAAQGLIQEGLDLYSIVGDISGVSRSLAVLGSVAMRRAEYTVSAQLHEQALVLARRIDDSHAVGSQLNALAQLAWLRGQPAQAEDRARDALEMMSVLGDQQAVAWALMLLGVAARCRDDHAGAEVLLEHSLDLSQQLSYREGVAWSLEQLGVLSRLGADYEIAQTRQQAALREHRQLGNLWRMASVLDELAALAVAQNAPERATERLAAAEQLRREICVPVPTVESSFREHTVAEAKSRLGPKFRALTLTGVARTVS